MRRPAHGTVVAYLALFCALGGGAYAAAKIDSNDIDKDAVLSKHIKADQVKASDIAGNSKQFQAVALVLSEDNGGTAFDTDQGLKERGFESVRSEGTGSYCVVPSGNLDPRKNPPIITVEYNSSFNGNFTAMWDSVSANACEDGEYDIQTFQGATGNNTNEASFVIMVP